MDSSQQRMINLSACSDATFENSLRTLPNNGRGSIADSTSRLLKTVYGFFPTTDVNLPTCSDYSQPLKTVYGRFPTTDAALLLIQLQDL